MRTETIAKPLTQSLRQLRWRECPLEKVLGVEDSNVYRDLRHDVELIINQRPAAFIAEATVAAVEIADRTRISKRVPTNGGSSDVGTDR